MNACSQVLDLTRSQFQAPRIGARSSAPSSVLVRIGLMAIAVAISTPLRAMAADSLVLQSMIVTGGNGNGVVDRHECNQMSIVLSNASAQAVLGVSAVLTAQSPGAEVTQSRTAYPDLTPGQAAAGLTPFEIGTAAWFECGTPIQFLLTITSTNGVTNVVTFQQSTPADCADGGGSCARTLSFAGGLQSEDLLQVGRLNRTGTNSTCADPTDCPGAYSESNGSLLRRYDAYGFANLSGDRTCVTVELITSCSPGGYPLFSAAYASSFDPSDVCQNYLGDIGVTPNPSRTYSFEVAPASRFVIVVHEVMSNRGCGDYQLKVTSEAGFLFFEPILKFRRLGFGSLAVAWPTNAVGFRLESTPSLLGSDFTLDTNVPGIDGEDFAITNSSGEPTRLYRLRKP